MNILFMARRSYLCAQHQIWLFIMMSTSQAFLIDKQESCQQPATAPHWPCSDYIRIQHGSLNKLGAISVWILKVSNQADAHFSSPQLYTEAASACWSRHGSCKLLKNCQIARSVGG